MKKNEPYNYTNGYDYVYRGYVRDYTQGIKRLFGGRRMTMSDHQDSEHFAYDKTWHDIETMLDKAERKQNQHYTAMLEGPKKKRMFHMRNYKALEGVVKALRWVLGDKNVNHPLE